jgi:hypothetical protein
MNTRDGSGQRAPVQLAFNRDQTRAAFRLFHPKGNIVTAEMIGAFRQALDTLAQHPHVKLVTIEGAGADFSFGASIPEHAPEEIGRVLPEAHALIHALLDQPAVTGAIVRGRCLGGGSRSRSRATSSSRSSRRCSACRRLRWECSRRRRRLLPPRVGTARGTRVRS